MGKKFEVDQDSFSSGQIRSKLWLCEELENIFDTIDTIWIYGGWYATTALLLKSRNNIKIKKIDSYDLDPTCEPIADMINENWVINEWEFKAHTVDCNLLKPAKNNPDLIINTSTEHFDTDTWFKNIPKGTTVVLQGNNMPHEDHLTHTETLDDFIKTFPVSEIYYQGQLNIDYDTWGFTRFMIIGVK